MKKVLALVLALATVLSLGVVSFAADNEVSVSHGTVYTDKGVVMDIENDTFTPDRKIYFSFGTAENALLNNEDGYKFSYKKGDNSKMIESIKLIEKNIGLGRQWYVEVKIKDDMTDTEFKFNPEFTFTAKEDLVLDPDDDNIQIPKGTKLVVDDITFWISNTGIENEDDIDRTAGTGGEIFKPVKNEENTVLWEDENNTLATLTFDADSNVSKYYPKMSTKWDNVKYAELFADQDAFVRQWVGTPSISSTSRAVLELNVPYIDEDDELTVDEDSIIVYEETADGELVDITAKGKFDWNDDDEFVFTMKTRSLGTYIFAEAPVTEADADDEVPADEVVDADKVNPGTGF